jgi:hypothetical protein
MHAGSRRTAAPPPVGRAAFALLSCPPRRLSDHPVEAGLADRRAGMMEAAMCLFDAASIDGRCATCRFEKKRCRHVP